MTLVSRSSTRFLLREYLFTIALLRLAITFVAGIVLAMACPAALAAWDINQLMGTLAQSKSGRTSFTETKYIALLNQPVESSGELLYTAPDHLEKRTLKPKPEMMVVDGDELMIERGRQKYNVQLQAYPELAGFIDSIRGTLAGNRKVLERNFALALEGSVERWTLALRPLEEKMLSTITGIRITGVRGQVQSIEVTQADGDRSVMTIGKLVLP